MRLKPKVYFVPKYIPQTGPRDVILFFSFNMFVFPPPRNARSGISGWHIVDRQRRRRRGMACEWKEPSSKWYMIWKSKSELIEISGFISITSVHAVAALQKIDFTLLGVHMHIVVQSFVVPLLMSSPGFFFCFLLICTKTSCILKLFGNTALYSYFFNWWAIDVMESFFFIVRHWN